jgi:hypothetical protein
MKMLAALAVAACLHVATAGAQVAPLVAGDLADALARLKNDAATGLIAKQFGDAYVAEWWNSSEAVLAAAAQSARYVSEQGPACLAIRSREGDTAAAWVTCSLGLEDETMLLGQSLGQLAQSLPDWERMAVEIDAANRSVTPLTDKALAAIDEILKRMREERY